MELQDVLKLLEIMEAHKLDEIEVEQGRARAAEESRAGAGRAARDRRARGSLRRAPRAGASPAPKPPESDKDLIKIPSPMVGTFYRSPSPEAEPFISEGDHIAVDQVVCIIEAMKVMNEIKSEVEGEIVGVHVENGESVEYGQPLFTVRRAAK